MNIVLKSLNMELPSTEESAAVQQEERPIAGHLSKSKQMLKKCINEMGGIQENGATVPGASRSSVKIAAPKPVRARTLAFSNFYNSKWMETSPIKNEIDSDSHG